MLVWKGCLTAQGREREKQRRILLSSWKQSQEESMTTPLFPACLSSRHLWQVLPNIPTRWQQLAALLHLTLTLLPRSACCALRDATLELRRACEDADTCPHLPRAHQLQGGTSHRCTSADLGPEKPLQGCSIKMTPLEHSLSLHYMYKC